MTTATPLSILFIDPAVTDIDALLAGVDPATEVVRLSADRDGLAQIAEALAGHSDVAAVHIVSHGAPGALTLGNGTVDQASLAAHAVELATIREALAEGADLLLYGCNVAEGRTGHDFMTALAEATGADIAASEDLTGAGSLGGDWVLEASTGAIEAVAIEAPGMATTLDSARGIFDNGYIKFGWSGDGSFGYGSNQTPGIFYDTTGNHVYPANADFLTPGSPFEFFAVKIGSSTFVNNNTSYTSPRMPTTTDTSGIVTAGGKTYGTLKFTSVINGLEIVQTYTLGATDQVISISVSIRNTTASTIYGVKYARGIDPDVDSPLGTTATHNNRGAGDIAASDIVLGTGPISNRVIGLYTNSSTAHNTSVSPGWSTDPAALLANSSNNYADSTINLAFDLGDIAAGQTKNFSLAYVFAANAAALEESVAQVPPSNPVPTLTDFAVPVDTVAEDTQVEITFAELAAQGNEADLNADGSPGSVTAFVVKAVSGGTLLIGTSAATATAWAPSSNDVVNGTLKAYWTPAANANGTLPAFTVVARDAEGAVSASPVTVRVNVTAVNDAPTLASDMTLTPVAEDAAVNKGATVAALVTPRFADVDGDALAGIVVVGNDADPDTEGHWEYSTDGGLTWLDVGTVSDANGLVLSAGTALRFAALPDWHGTPSGLTVHGVDSAFAGDFTSGATRATFDTTTDAVTSGVSVDSRTIGTTIASVNDAPVFTSAPAAIGLSETAGDDVAAALDSGLLTGTLTATDVDDDTADLSFAIRGGTEAGGSYSKAGLFGTLTLDAATGAWSYAATNMVALNALAEGAVATETFEVKVVDPHGAESVQTLTVTFTGTNDVPVLASAVADQVFDGAGAWTFQIPANAFTDAEGLPLNYKIEVLDGGGNVIHEITAATGLGTDPTAWLSFDPASRTLTGTPLDGALPLTFKVTATDSEGASVDSTFELTLVPGASDANTAVNAPPVSTNDRISVDVNTPHVLSLSDFGAYADPEGDPLAVVQIVNLPGSGTVELSDGSTWTAIDPGRTISAADISQGYLRISGATDATSIDFRVSDGAGWSDKTYQLAVDVYEEAGTAQFADSSVSTAQASTWTNVYTGDALSGYTGTVRVVVDVTGGGTVRLSSLPAGVTAITQGYDSPTDGSATSIAFEGSLADVNAALQLLQANRGTHPDVTLNISAIKGGAAYNPLNGHYYEVVSSPGISWSDAQVAAAGRSFNGLTGYLATITSSAENDFLLDKLPADAWIGASDAGTEGTWMWMTGPEAGQVFSIGNDAPIPQGGHYVNWNAGEPNDSDGDEDYAQFYAAGGVNPGRWNDLDGTSQDYYIVEYGGNGGTLQEQASRTITLSAAEPSISVAGTAAYTENAVPKALNPALALADVDNATLASATVAITAGFEGSDVLALVNDPATMGNIAGSYNAVTGVLTLLSDGATATLAQWTAALKAVTFASTSDTPAASRTVSWSVSDGTYISNVGTTSIVITAVNDGPAVGHLNDVTVAAGTPLSLNVGSPFSDPEGDAITYSATLADGSPLPDWLSFDPDTHVFSGNPPAGTPYYTLRVVGTDAHGASASSSFTLHLTTPAEATSAANNPGVVTVTGTPRQGETLTANPPSDDDGYTGGVAYQWQVSADGLSWTDVTGARGQGQTLTLAESESAQYVRVQAFYNDNGGTAEAPVSTAVEVENVNDAGSAVITGSPVPGQTLVATLTDPDGLIDAEPTYRWFRDGVEIAGATYSAYTLTNDDGGKHISVEVSYTDDHGTAEVVTYTKPEPIQLGAVAPVASNDTATATEAGGLANAVPGSNASGNLLANDSDANAGDTLSVTGLRMGAAEGLGRPASEDGGDFVIAGDYGTLRVNKATGAYTYEVAQDNDSVQAMRPGDSLVETFNYTVSDSSLLSDTARLSITINGANDFATVAGIAGAAVVAEDVPTALPLALTITDPDGSGSFALRLHVDAGTLRAVSTDSGVVITGSDTGTLTITAGSPFAIQGWLADNPVLYVTEPNVHGSDIATLSYSLDDGSGAGFVALPGTTSITSTDTNDAAIVDLDGSTPGNNFTTTFRPRGGEVAVVADSVTITDIDPADGLMSAVVTLAGGAFDNAFGTTYETLRSTAGDAFEGSLGTIVITGNGTGPNGLTGATQLTFTGAGTQHDYEAALKTVFYNNANPNAFSGDRTITVTVSDSVNQESDASLFSILAPNADIAVGQRIFIDGEDSGYTVAAKVDDQNFVASGPLSGLDAGSALSFYAAGSLVTTAVQSGPTIATTTIEVPWTPVIDMSGETIAGRDHAVTYTEGQAGVAIAKADASITDQDGNIASVVVTLTNPLDGGAESLFISGALQTQLASMGITVTGSGTHQVTLSGDKDATFFQIGLRGIQYANTSDHPDVTQRVVGVASTDVDGNTGVGAKTTINLVAVNDAPTGTDGTVTAAEDTAQVLAVSDFGFVDVDGNSFASLTVVSLPASGTLTLDGVAVTAGQVITVADIAAGKFVYTPAADVSGAAAASFGFKVQDDGGTANGGVELDPSANTLTFDLTPANDAPVMTAAAPQLAAIGEDDLANAGQRVSDFVGAGAGKTGVADADTLNNGGAGHAPEAVGQGIAIHALANDGPAAGGAWEYSIDDGATWIAVGAVSEGSALLLGANDRIRFVPDGENGTTATFSYYLWDGAAGTAGDKADAAARGGASAFSTGSDTATIVVTPVNDAATIDLNGAAGGTGYTAVFRPRGEGVAVVGDDIVIGDVDRLDAGTPDTLVSATVALAGGTLDNQFGVTYETLHSTAGSAYEGSLGTIVITGNGSGANGLTEATVLTFTGAGTRADYESALKTVIYDNANPNAFSGDRTVEITVRDASVSTGDAGDGLESAVAVATVQVPWTPVIDMNGDAAEGRNANVSYTEHAPGVAIAAPDASIVDQDGNIATVTITLTNPLDGAAEKLFVAPSLVAQLASVGITISGNDTHAIILSGNRDGTVFQLALRAIRYVNESHDADLTPRVVTIAAVDQAGNDGVGAQTVINLVPVNDAPEGIDSSATLDEDTSHTFAMADFGHTDAEGDALQSVVITTLPGTGTLTLDGVAVTAGQEIAVADIDAGKLVYTPLPDANGVPSTTFTFQLRDTGGTANGGADLDATPNTFTLNVTPVNDAPTGSVTMGGSVREGATLTALPAITDVDRTSGEIDAATTYQWQVRTVPDGAWTDVAGATGATFVPTAAERNHEVRVVVTYEDVSSPLATVTYDSAVAGQPAIVGDTDGNIELVIDTDEPVIIWMPEGDVDVTNTGAGPLTVEGLPDGGTLTVDGEGDTTLSNPLGDVNVDNAGPGTVTVTGLPDDATVTTSGDGDVVIDDPLGGVELVNHGDGEVTVIGLNDGETLDVSGDGPTTVADPDGDLTVANAGPGTVTATGVNDGAVVATSGNGPVVIDDPEGSLEVVNAGPGQVTVSGIDDGAALVVDGSGPTTVADPDGDLDLTNNGTGYVTVTGAADGAQITTAGTGDVYVRSPQGDLDLVNNQSGGGDLFVDHAQDGATLNVSGPGPTRLTNPEGDLTIDNAGPGVVTARCLVDGKTVTTSGAGDIVIGNPRGDVVLVNQGPGTVTVEELHAGHSVDVSGAGPTTVDPDGDATVNNAGPGTVTTTGVANGATLGFGGDGPQVVDLSGIPAGGDVTLNNGGGANVEVRNLPADAVVHANGSGDVTLQAPSGDITVDNDGTGTVFVDQVADGVTVTKTGSGPAVIDHPVGGFTLDNGDTGLVTVRHLDPGQTLVVEGTGPVAVEADLAAGERIVVDTSANSNVQLSNLGAGVIDVVGDLTLDGDDALTLTLNGAGTTELTVTGEVSLAGTPLRLQLDPAYDANLGDTITLLDNDGTDAIVGTFDGLPEGAPVYVGGQLFSISYVGGSGNDVVLTRINDAPTGAVTVNGTPAQGQTLTASHTLADTDGLGTVSYRWLADGTLLAVGASYVVGQEAVGKAITVVASYTDAEGTVETVTSAATAPIANVNDAPTGQVLIAGTATLGQTLVASNTLADADGMGAVSYQWQADGADIAGATGASLLVGRGEIGKVLTVVASYTDGYGAGEHVSSAPTVQVADGTVGVSPDVEAQVPGLGSGLAGDGNGDGVADTLQPSVASTALGRGGDAPSTFVTLVVDSVDGKVREGSTDRLMEFSPVDTPSDLPSWAQLPAGEIGFTAAVDAAGVTKNFSLYVDKDLGVNGYWSKNADGVLVNLASEAYGGRIVEEGGKLRLDFQITEGGEFDHGTAGDTTIVNHGAAGHASLSLIGYTVDTPVAADGVNMWD